ncbi:MAG: YezD family protein [Sedimentisphaerales bacterium]|nr:YezD family protein [Sedimentisphaerales bacterium]
MRSEYRPGDALTQAVLEELGKAVARLKYGTITLKVHDGRVTQMDITEKRRFDESPGFQKGEGI